MGETHPLASGQTTVNKESVISLVTYESSEDV